MDSNTFDSLVRRLGRRTDRRSLLGTALAIGAGAIGLSQSDPTLAQTPCSNPATDCAAGQICAGGQCQTCSSGLSPCTTYCADLSNDPDNCGICGSFCPSRSCANGICADASSDCGPGLTSCASGCADVLSDAANCGFCGNVCDIPAGPSSVAICSQGTCQTVCVAGAVSCNGQCADLSSSSQHCGSCGNTCPSGLICCGGRCVGPGSAARFCNWCGSFSGWPQGCNANEVCDRGLCITVFTCEDGLTDCGDICVDLATDPLHCGACGNPCVSRACGEGECLHPDDASPEEEFATETDALFYLLRMERVNQAVLETALGQRRQSGIDNMDQEIQRRLTAMLRNDTRHIMSLQRLLRERGVEIPDDRTPRIRMPSTIDDFVVLAAGVKALVVAAYADVLTRLPSLATESQLGLVLSVEARHEAYLALLSDGDPFARDQERTISRPTALHRIDELVRF